MATMDGQVALVTGGARGIGLAISTRLAERGVKVAVGYSHGADTAKQFAAAHEGSTIHQGNIGVAADCERVISEVLEQHGQLDILCLLYTSDAADERSSVDLGGRRII